MHPAAAAAAVDPGVPDVDVRGPMGTTPLMIASYRGGGLDTGDLNENEMENGPDSKAAVIQELIAQGAKLSATMEKTQETPLHLAARQQQ